MMFARDFILKITTMVVIICGFTGCYDSFNGGGADVDPSLDITPNTTIKALHEMLISERLDIRDEMIVMGSITANDRSGNIYNSFFMEADGYAVEVLEGRYDSYVHRVEGYKTLVNLNGLSIAREDGVLRIGLKSADGSYYTLDYLSAEVVIDQHISNTYLYEEVTPAVRQIAELEEWMCGSLIEVGGLTHVPDADATQPYVWSGYQCFVDGSGNMLWSNTSDYADFVNEVIPSTTVTLRGILQRAHITSVDGDSYIIVMRDVEDWLVD